MQTLSSPASPACTRRQRRSTLARSAASAEAQPAAALGEPYEGVFDKPLRDLKFSRGNDGGAYLSQKSADPAYDAFTVGDKILEVRRV